MEDDDLMVPIRYNDGSFENPFPRFDFPGGGKMCRYFRDRFSSNAPTPTRDEYDRNLPVIKPQLSKLQNPPEGKLQYMWIGHATVLYQFDGWNVLSDPIWGERCSPISFIGPKRYRPPPLTIDELPDIDAVVISHNHYDHLCISSVTALNSRFGDQLQWFVPEGLGSWMSARGCRRVTELSWWESASPDDLRGMKRDKLDIVCTPAQHWSLRSGFDRNKSLWSSWIFKTEKHSVWFSGDTGYCPAFKVIGKKYGPFDLSAIAIGAYCPRYMMAAQHINPEEAFQIHKDLQSKLSIGIHWGTFPMGSLEPYMEPKEIIERLQQEDGGQFPFITVSHGAIHTQD
ncbi:N-acyl-phosphatidylethanolamine-hydrolyzing phospholipase D-like [Watersipora subatra]|uniref:N-acyl-phosphatidylethanolamine-hydrolyzing phospholipase D-like n=1 Tax=Watersipora subatra TaxID=2589382 RepID=UPI00355B554F